MRKLAEDIKDVEQEKKELEAKSVAEDSKRLGVKNWLPYKGPDTLPKAVYKKKERLVKGHDGEHKTIVETFLAEEGAPAYLVFGQDLLEKREGYGGVKQRLVRTFKTRFPDTATGRQAKAKQAAFRAMLRSKGIPGA